MPPAAANAETPKPSPGRANGTDPIDPYEEPVSYLRSKGWKPLGIPTHQNCLWLDPTRPLKETWREVPINSWHPPQSKGAKPEYRQVQCPTGHVGQKQPGVRKVCTPKGEPMSLQQALQTQIERDARELEKSLAK